MELWVENILTWISQNPHWAGLAVFLIAFLESLAIIGLAMPGWLLLVGVGSLIGGGSLNFWLMSLFSFAGAYSGQALSYAFGYHYKDKVHHWSWFQRHQKMMDNAETFFEKHGFAGILIGQFIGPIRAVIALMAGILGMSRKSFYIAIGLAAMIWAPVYLLPGVLLGAALTFDKGQVWIIMAIIATILCCLWLIGRFVKDSLNKASESSPEPTAGANFPLTLGKKRFFSFLASSILLVGVLTFLIYSQYGSLMLDLLNKIWQVVS